MAVRAEGKGGPTWSDALLGRPWPLIAAVVILVALPVLMLGQASENDTRARLRTAELDSAAGVAAAVNKGFDAGTNVIFYTLVSMAHKPKPESSLMGTAVQRGDIATLRSLVTTVQTLYVGKVLRAYIAVRGDADTINDATIVAESPVGGGLVGQRLSARRSTPAGANAEIIAGAGSAVDTGAFSDIYAGSADAPSGQIYAATLQAAPGTNLQGRVTKGLGTIVVELDIARAFAEFAKPFLGPGDDAYLLDTRRLLAGRAQAETPFPMRDLSMDPTVQLFSATPGAVQAGLADPLGGGTRVISSARPPLTSWLILVVRDTSAVDHEIDAVLGQLATARYVLVALLLLGAFLVAQAIGAQIRQRHLLAVANDRIGAASLHKSAFLSSMSHELRTPLNSINGFSDVLLSGIGGTLTEKQREYLTDIRGSGEHLLALVNDVLDLSRVEAGRLDLHSTDFDLREAIESAHRTVAPLAQEKGQELRLDPGDGGTVRLDQARFRQVLLNVLGNAVKYTPQGGQVTTSVARHGGAFRITVRDSGIGIAPEDQARVFDDFTRIDNAYARTQQGTGLGLALARRLVRLMGGDITLDSEPGRGSTFTITVPAA